MRIRKQGNATVLIVPAKFNMQSDVEYVAYKGHDDAITFVKKAPNIFKQAVVDHQEIDIGSEFSVDSQSGNEQI
ncbi:type II toxin-antitoxin system PemI/MazE family antitoxin [Latilactobacillus fuchuensis]|uniref:AbrB family transcriptional regulator n=1 Tax=Latilactobacillus fuchuensis DSM 14340 = JCM 11249 TaxID=1423747 RepID=A0A0R1RR85_9LACO|nr:hypothetical protein [Latilactobacillus fuchuensis]KRL59526.1 hypothetical protein FC69_GL001613 [Latilactobacillus fuchuensis DSM 14340 = JCM 11249]